jgi:hypothetical protein
MMERRQIIVKFFASHILLMPLLIILNFVLDHDNLLFLSIVQTILFILLLAGYWEFIGLAWKRTYCLVMEAGILFSVELHLIWGFNEPGRSWLYATMMVLLIYLLFILGKIILIIFSHEPEKMEIAFPFDKGRYLITDGGNSKISRLMNYHYHSAVHKKKGTNKSMLFATDIVKISDKGLVFMPFRNEDYPVFNQAVLSPMDGIVVKVENGIADNIPFSGNYPYNTGNTVVIKKDQYYFLLGHLKMGSICVKVGDFVKSGVVLGLAGNSGMSERPHLHMQLMKSDTDDYWKGLGICIQYNKKNLYKNRTIKI